MNYNSTSRYIPKKMENISPHKNIHANVHSSIIHHGQNKETAQCPSTDEWINKCGISIEWSVIQP